MQLCRRGAICRSGAGFGPVVGPLGRRAGAGCPGGRQPLAARPMSVTALRAKRLLLAGGYLGAGDRKRRRWLASCNSGRGPGLTVLRHQPGAAPAAHRAGGVPRALRGVARPGRGTAPLASWPGWRCGSSLRQGLARARPHDGERRRRRRNRPPFGRAAAVIELAAAEPRDPPPPGLLDRLEQRLPVLTGGRAGVLPPGSKRCVCCLPAPTTSSAAGIVHLFAPFRLRLGRLGSAPRLPSRSWVMAHHIIVFDDLASLVDKSLVRQEDDATIGDLSLGSGCWRCSRVRLRC